MTRKRTTRKLTLHRETLRHLEPGRSLRQNDSCVLSCYDMSCEGGCGLSDGAATAA